MVYNDINFRETIEIELGRHRVEFELTDDELLYVNKKYIKSLTHYRKPKENISRKEMRDMFRTKQKRYDKEIKRLCDKCIELQDSNALSRKDIELINLRVQRTCDILESIDRKLDIIWKARKSYAIIHNTPANNDYVMDIFKHNKERLADFSSDIEEESTDKEE